MNINVVFKEDVYTTGGDLIMGFKLTNAAYTSSFVSGTESSGKYMVIPMASVAYLEIPAGPDLTKPVPPKASDKTPTKTDVPAYKAPDLDKVLSDSRKKYKK